MWRYKHKLLRKLYKEQQLNGLLTTYNLKSTVNFTTSIAHKSSTAIDIIFVDRSGNYIIHCLIHGLSDHDTQLILLNNVIIPYQASEVNLITK